MANFKKMVKKGKKAFKKAMNTETAKEFVRKEKLLIAEMLIETANKIKKQANKKK